MWGTEGTGLTAGPIAGPAYRLHSSACALLKSSSDDSLTRVWGVVPISMPYARIRGILLLIAMVAMMLPASARVSAAEIYVFKQSDGTRLYTDQKKRAKGLTYISTFGRPTAYSSCGRMTRTALQQRGDSYEPLIAKHAAAQDVPPELVRAVMHVESCFERRAVSRVGARGLMQLMPGTATQLGVKDSFDASQNIAGGVRYLRMMRDRYPSDWKLVLAAYNAGPGAVDKYNGIPPYPETQGYVKKVMALYAKSLKPPPAKAVESIASADLP
jgi:soluble lytic murein transglycosylase-like protein